MKVKSESEVVQSRLTPSDSMDCSLPGSSLHGIFQARVLEWVAIAFSKSSSLHMHKKHFSDFPSLVGKESTCSAGDPGSIYGSGRSTGEGIGYPRQCS